MCNRSFGGFPDKIDEYPDELSQITESHQQVMLDKCWDRADNDNSVFDNLPDVLVEGRPSRDSMLMHYDGGGGGGDEEIVPSKKRAIESLLDDAEEEMSQPKKKTRFEEAVLAEEVVDEIEEIDEEIASYEYEPGAQAGEELHFLEKRRAMLMNDSPSRGADC